MRSTSLLSRYIGDGGQELLVEVLKSQMISGGDAVIASKLAAAVNLVEIQPGELLIKQGDADNDMYFVIAGVFRIFVNDRETASRRAGQHIGEMALIDPSARRSASVIASEPCVVAQIDDKAFTAIAAYHPSMWRALALELCRRLDERKKFLRSPNIKPIIFIGSSTEHLEIATSINGNISSEIATTILWSKDIFGASTFPIDDLEAQLHVADFALLVAGPDDHVTSRGETVEAPRDNIIFEIGLFMGALSRARTFLLTPNDGNIKIPSDLLGLMCLTFDIRCANLDEATKKAGTELGKIISRLCPK